MLSTSHGALALALTGRPAVALGAVLPDLPAFAAGAVLLVGGARRDDLLERLYHRSPSRELQLVAHSVLLPAALAVAGARGVAAGALSHVLVDVLTHHDDAWPPLWPASSRRWRSPVSYWQPAHHARAFQVAECAVLAVAARRRRSARAALLVAALPLLRGAGGGLAGVAGVRVDACARQRDLA